MEVVHFINSSQVFGSKAKQSTKVAIVSDHHPSEFLGGGGVIAYEIYLNLQKEMDCQFWFGTLSDTVRSDKHEKSLKVLKRSGLSQLIYEFRPSLISFKFFRLIVSQRPDIIWFHQIGNNLPYHLILLSKLFQVKTLMTLHDFLPISRYKIQPARDLATLRIQLFHKRRPAHLRYILNRAILKQVNTVICIASHQRDIYRLFGFRIDAIVNNGIDQRKTDSLGIPQVASKFTVLFGGRLNMKGFEETVAGISLDPSAFLIFAGGADLLDYANQHLPHERFEYLGLLSRDQFRIAIGRCDVVSVLSQYFDIFPTVALEAVASGKFFITTWATGVAELIKYGRETLILEIGEVPDFTKIREFMELNKLSDCIKIPQNTTDWLEKYRIFLKFS